VLLKLPPLQWLGGRSYGIYLWHWPLLVLLDARVASPSPWARLVTLTVAVLLAGITYILVENPVRHQRALVASVSRSIGAGAVLSGLVVVGSVVGLGLSNHLGGHTGYTAPTLSTIAPVDTVDRALAPEKSTSAPPSTSTSASASTDVSTASATTSTAAPTTTLAPADELERRVQSELQPLIDTSVGNQLLPDNLRPALAKIASDKTTLYSNGCMANFSMATNPACEFGDPQGETTIALFGDSHAAQWFPGLELVARRNHWKILALTKMGCPSADLSVSLNDGGAYGGCDLWRWRTVKRLLASTASLVIITNYRFQQALTGSLTASVWKEALSRTVSALVAGGKRVLLMADTPTVGNALAGCVVAHQRSLNRCDRRVSDSISMPFRRVESDVATRFGVQFYDEARWLCTANWCPPVIGDVAVYLDSHHITNTYGAFLAPYLELLVRDALSKVPPHPSP
jgi:hypothetical protein